MVHGASTKQNPTLRTTPRKKAREKRGTIPRGLSCREAKIVVKTRVSPTAATNSPLSGRNKTATPPIKPVPAHQTSDCFLVLLRNAKVAATQRSTARNVVDVSVS